MYILCLLLLLIKKNKKKQHKITYTRNMFNNIRCRQNVEEKINKQKRKKEMENKRAYILWKSKLKKQQTSP